MGKRMAVGRPPPFHEKAYLVKGDVEPLFELVLLGGPPFRSFVDQLDGHHRCRRFRHASIRTQIGSLLTGCMLESVQYGRCNLSGGLPGDVSDDTAGPGRGPQSPGLGDSLVTDECCWLVSLNQLGGPFRRYAAGFTGWRRLALYKGS